MPGYRVTLQGVSYTAPGTQSRLLDGISLVVEPGEFLAIIGPNGAGKSLLLSTIAGELPGVSGTVIVGNTPIRRPANRDIDGVGVVHQQDKLDLIGNLSIEQNMYIRTVLGGGYKNRWQGVSGEWSADIAAKLTQHAPRLSPDDGLKTLVKHLAGGQRQMLSMAIAVHFEHIENPCRLLLLDECTASLAPKAKQEVLAYAAERAQNSDITTIMVTHHMEEVIREADRVIGLAKGKIVCELKKPHITEEELRHFFESNVE